MTYSDHSILVNLKELVIEGDKVPLNSLKTFSLELQVSKVGNVDKVANAVKYTFKLPSDKVKQVGRGNYKAKLTLSQVTENKEYNFTDDSLTIDVLNEIATFKGKMSISKDDSELKELITSQFKEIKFEYD